MKLERLALWDEKYLFTEQGETDKGFIGWLKSNFNEDRLVLSDMEITGENDYMIRYELESLYFSCKRECGVYAPHSFRSQCLLSGQGTRPRSVFLQPRVLGI